VTKRFTLTERLALEFSAEGFNILNHHNYYVNARNLDAFNFRAATDPVTSACSTPGPITVSALKGSLDTNNVSGVNHDERRFGQFALRFIF